MNSQKIEPSYLRSVIKQKKMLQSDIAIAVGCDQGQVSRLLAGHTSTGSKTYRLICEYVMADEHQQDRIGEKIIASAINSLWDGTREHARTIADLLNLLGKLKKH